MSVFNEVTAATVSGALAFGMVLTLLGSLKLALGKRMNSASEEGIEVRVAWLMFAFNLALIPTMLLSGILLYSIQAAPLMALGSVLTAISLFILAWTARGQTDFRRAWLAILVLGLGGACLSTSSIVLMPKAFFRGAPNQITAAITLGHVFVGLGMLLMPVLADLLLNTIKFRRTLAVLGVLALAPLAFVLLTNGSAFDVSKSFTLQP
ncbi:MAG TPA: hypothetical protein VKD72_27190, partial [Gemmataceae bacterium]|nr:hypothetical protein [Gemmataceae bacterium]